MVQPAALPFLAHFAALQDPRQTAKVLYPLPELLLLLLCGTVAGADDFVELALWGGEHLPFLRRFLPFARGIPSHDTLCEVVAALDPALFKTCFANWVERLRDPGPETIAIDGKTSRRSHARSRGRGPLVRVTFDSAESLQTGQSQVKFKDMQMGTVQGFELTPDRKHVVTSIRMTAQAEELLTEGAQFWVVKPRVYAGDITGLNTILTGTYIAMQPGEAGQPAKREFTGLVNPPTLVPDTPGRAFKLTASRLGAITLGTPVFFHDLDVGRVAGWDFTGMAESVTLHIFVNAPYAGWVHKDSRFWNSSGIELRVGPEGVRLQVDSLKAAVLGGITFDTPSPGDKAGLDQAAASAEGDSFPLYANQEVADTATARRRAALASYFTGSVGGLAVGAHVTLQGMAIGDVTSVDLQYSTDTDQTRVRVGFALQLDRVKPIGDKPVQPFQDYLPTLVREGLRVRLRGGNLITGQKEVALEFLPAAPAAWVAQEGDVQVIPADNEGGGGLDDLTSTASQLMAKISAVPFAEIGQNLTGVLHGANRPADPPPGGADPQPGQSGGGVACGAPCIAMGAPVGLAGPAGDPSAGGLRVVQPGPLQPGAAARRSPCRASAGRAGAGERAEGRANRRADGRAAGGRGAQRRPATLPRTRGDRARSQRDAAARGRQ